MKILAQQVEPVEYSNAAIVAHDHRDQPPLASE